MTTPKELDIKIKSLQAQLDSKLTMRQPVLKVQPAQQTQPAQRFTINHKSPKELRVVINELQNSVPKFTKKPKTPKELDNVINELRQQLNII